MNTETVDLVLKAVDEPPGCREAWNDWRWQLRNVIKDVYKLAEVFHLEKHDLEKLQGVVFKYPFGITPYYLSLADKNDKDDPIRKQCVPSLEEVNTYSEVKEDPLGEECDNGASNSDSDSDACRTDCKNPYCGDGVIDAGEFCDDGNTADGDGCSSTCQDSSLKLYIYFDEGTATDLSGNENDGFSV